jgi:hypothetical protein
MSALRVAGFEVTSEWVERIAEAGAANAGVPGAVANAAAAANEAAIVRSHVLVVMAPEEPSIVSFGAGYELGFANATPGIWTVWLGDLERSVFSRRCSYHVTNELELLKHLRVIRGSGGTLGEVASW